MTDSSDQRLERDAMGAVPVPAERLYGAQTARAANWSFGGPMPREVVVAIARIKAAAARVHGGAGRLPAAVADAIARAADEVVAGRHAAEFVLPVFQTGSGTSTHMNVNEVVANRAAALLGQPVGERSVHPNDHVNLAQSSNDVVPSALQIAAVELADGALAPALAGLVGTLHELADRHWDEVRNGRTHLMTATPIRFGQQFRGAAQRIAACARRIAAAVDECRALPLGGTAVGTGVNCPPGFASAVCAGLRSASGVPFVETDTHLAAAGTLDLLAHLSGQLRLLAGVLHEVVGDLRWQASSALAEIELPALQPGSSIMPGKRNPVVCEAVLMVCAQVMGNDAVVAFASSQTSFELNTTFPVVAKNLLEALHLLASASRALDEHALRGLRIAPSVGEGVARNPMLATALAPAIGYDRAAAIAKEAAATGRSVLDVAVEHTGIERSQLVAWLDPRRLCGEDGAPGSATSR